MDWLAYGTLYLQVFLALPMIYLVFYVIGGALLAPVVNRMYSTFRNIQARAAKNEKDIL